MLSFISNRNLSRAAVGAGLLAATVACGQEAPRREIPRNPDVIEHLEFPGGTLESFVTHLQAEGDGVLMNVLYRNGAQFVEIPAIELQSVHFITAINATLLDIPVQHQRIQTGGLGSEVNVFTGNKRANLSSAVIARTTEVLSVGDLFSNGSTLIDDLLEAIDVAVFDETRQRPEYRPEIRFHKKSGLLIVRGTDTQVRIAGDVVEQLSTRTLDQRDRERTLASERIQREADIVDLKAQIRIMDEQFQIEMANVNRTIELRDSGAVRDEDVMNAQLSMVTLALEQEKVQNRLRAAEAQLALLEREDAVDRTEKTYEIGTVSGVMNEIRVALAAISTAIGSKIEAKQTESELAVTATSEQHAVIAAVIRAMKAAAAQDPH